MAAAATESRPPPGTRSPTRATAVSTTTPGERPTVDHHPAAVRQPAVQPGVPVPAHRQRTTGSWCARRLPRPGRDRARGHLRRSSSGASAPCRARTSNGGRRAGQRLLPSRGPQQRRCLDVPGQSTANGLQLQQWDCNGTVAQPGGSPRSPKRSAASLIDAFSESRYARSRPGGGRSRRRTASATRRCRMETRCPARQWYRAAHRRIARPQSWPT